MYKNISMNVNCPFCSPSDSLEGKAAVRLSEKNRVVMYGRIDEAGIL